MKNIILLLFVAIFCDITIVAQVAINNDGSAADNSAILDVKSTTKGVLLPRMNQSQIMYINNPVNGLLVYNTDNNRFYFYDDGEVEWKQISVGSGTITPWVCGDALIDTRDSKSYATVQIGSQCWMAENFNIGTRIDGSNNQTNNNEIEKYCYNDDLANCIIYGGLYQWDEMMQYVTTEGVQGICPDGWQLPTDAEYTILTTYLGDISNSGGKMKETGIIHWNSPNTDATNESGFTALPGGNCLSGGFYYNIGSYGYFWSSTYKSGTYAWYRSMYYGTGAVRVFDKNKTTSHSVRCLKN